MGFQITVASDMHSRPMSEPHHPGDRGLVLIGAVKLLQGLLLLGFAFGFLRFVHRDMQEVVADWLDAMHFDMDSHYIVNLLASLSEITDTQIRTLSGVAFVYSGVFLTEGIGLIRRKRWAEYLTVIATALLIPVELYEVIRHFGPVKLAILVLNIAIVWFLIRLLRREPAATDVLEPELP